MDNYVCIIITPHPQNYFSSSTSPQTTTTPYGIGHPITTVTNPKRLFPHPYPSTRYITGQKQREPKPRQSPQDIDSPVRTRPVHTIRFEEVRTRTLENDSSANKRQNNTDVRNDPVGSVLCGPAVDEEADGGTSRLAGIMSGRRNSGLPMPWLEVLRRR